MQSMLILHVVAAAQTCEESCARDIKKRLNSQYTVALRGTPLVFTSLVFNRICSLHLDDPLGYDYSYLTVSQDGLFHVSGHYDHLGAFFFVNKKLFWGIGLTPPPPPLSGKFQQNY